MARDARGGRRTASAESPVARGDGLGVLGLGQHDEASVDGGKGRRQVRPGRVGGRRRASRVVERDTSLPDHPSFDGAERRLELKRAAGRVVVDAGEVVAVDEEAALLEVDAVDGLVGAERLDDVAARALRGDEEPRATRELDLLASKGACHEPCGGLELMSFRATRRSAVDSAAIASARSTSMPCLRSGSGTPSSRSSVVRGRAVSRAASSLPPEAVLARRIACAVLAFVPAP